MQDRATLKAALGALVALACLRLVPRQEPHLDEDREGAAQAELFAAYVVAEDGSPEQAATLFRLVCDATDSTLVRLGALTGLHQCLSTLGDHDGAARVRDELDALREGLGAD